MDNLKPHTCPLCLKRIHLEDPICSLGAGSTNWWDYIFFHKECFMKEVGNKLKNRFYNNCQTCKRTCDPYLNGSMDNRLGECCFEKPPYLSVINYVLCVPCGIEIFGKQYIKLIQERDVDFYYKTRDLTRFGRI